MEKLNSTDNSYNSFYCFIVNNKSEALYFVETYNLKIKKKYNLIPIYSNDSNNIWLAINQNKIPSTLTPIYLKNCAKANEQTTWIVFSFSFLCKINSPKFFVIDEIIDFKKKNKLYPSVSCLKKFERKSVQSSDKTSENLDYTILENIYEVFKTLEKLVNKELIFVTTISLPENNKLFNIKKNLIIRIQKKFITEIINLSDEIKTTIFPSSYVLNFYDKIKEDFKFSVYEKNLLQNLLKQFNPDDLNTNLRFIKKLENGKVVINHLKKMLS